MTKTLLLFLMGAWVLPLAPQVRDNPEHVGTASLAGSVVTPDAPGFPVSNALVSLTDAEGGMRAKTALTDGAGRFSFTAVPAGRFDVSATKPAYLKGSYGALLPGRLGTPIAVKAGQRITEVTIQLWRGAVISGTIRDERGTAVGGVFVSALRFQLVDGSRALSPAAAARVAADDRGEYRLFGLPPGDYAVIASPGPSSAPTPLTLLTDAGIQSALAARDPGRLSPNSAALAVSTGYAPVYFPGTTIMSEAGMVTLQAGEERADVSFPLSLKPLADVSGTLGLPAGVTIDELRVSGALTAYSDVSRGAARRSLSFGADGTFIARGIPPGRYQLAVLATMKQGRDDGSVSTWSGIDTIDISGRDVIEPVGLVPASTISGRVEFDPQREHEDPKTGFEVRVTPTDGPAWQSVAGKVKEDGTFELVGIVPGRYVLFAQSTGQTTSGTWSFVQARASGRDIADLPFEVGVSARISGVTVGFSNHPSELFGNVHSDAGQDLGRLFLIVFPTDSAYWTSWSRRARQVRPATDGSYRVMGLPPGEYAVVALSDVQADEWRDSTFLGQLLPLSRTRVTLAAGERLRQDLSVPRRDGHRR